MYSGMNVHFTSMYSVNHDTCSLLPPVVNPTLQQGGECLEPWEECTALILAYQEVEEVCLEKQDGCQRPGSWMC